MPAIPADSFLTFILSNPMTRPNQVLLATVWMAWFSAWLKEIGCSGISVEYDADMPIRIKAEFYIAGMPNKDSMIELPVPETPYTVHVMTKVRTGCSSSEEG